MPPHSTTNVYSKHTESIAFIQDKYPNSKMVIVGDYNIPSSVPPVDCEQILFNDLLLVGCTQTNKVCNSCEEKERLPNLVF